MYTVKTDSTDRVPMESLRQAPLGTEPTVGVREELSLLSVVECFITVK